MPEQNARQFYISEKYDQTTGKFIRDLLANNFVTVNTFSLEGSNASSFGVFTPTGSVVTGGTYQPGTGALSISSSQNFYLMGISASGTYSTLATTKGPGLVWVGGGQSGTGTLFSILVPGFILNSGTDVPLETGAFQGATSPVTVVAPDRFSALAKFAGPGTLSIGTNVAGTSGSFMVNMWGFVEPIFVAVETW